MSKQIARAERDLPSEYARRRAAWAPIFAALDRQQPRITRATVAASLGITKQALSYYEIGKNRPPEWCIAALCKLARVPKRAILAPLGAENGPRDFYLQPLTRVRRPRPDGHYHVFLLPLDGDEEEESDGPTHEHTTPHAAVAAR